MGKSGFCSARNGSASSLRSEVVYALSCRFPGRLDDDNTIIAVLSGPSRRSYVVVALAEQLNHVRQLPSPFASSSHRRQQPRSPSSPRRAFAFGTRWGTSRTREGVGENFEAVAGRWLHVWSVGSSPEGPARCWRDKVERRKREEMVEASSGPDEQLSRALSIQSLTSIAGRGRGRLQEAFTRSKPLFLLTTVSTTAQSSFSPTPALATRPPA